MRIVITGATGFIGGRLMGALASEGHELVTLSRSPERARQSLRVPSQNYPWDATLEEAPVEALSGAGAIMHLAGEGVAVHRWSPEQKRKILDSRVLGTRHLLATVARLPKKPGVFLSASAIGFYGDRGDEILSEASPKGTGFLSDVCQAWESELIDTAIGGMRKGLIRTGIVLGSEGGALQRLIPLFKSGLGGPVGSGRQWMSWIHVDDLVALYLRALHDATLSGILNGVSPNPVTNAEFSVSLGQALGRPAVIPVPGIAVKMMMGEMASLVLGSQRVLPSVALRNGFSFRYPTVKEALAQIREARKHS